MRNLFSLMRPGGWSRWLPLALLLLALPWQAVAQVTTTETFENTPDNATSFTSNGQTFNVTPVPGIGANGFKVEDFNALYGYQFGWNGTANDNKAFTNDGQSGLSASTQQTQFTISTANGAGITVKSFWVNLSSSVNDCNGTTGNFTIAGRRSGTQVFTASVNSATLQCGTNLSVNNGFNLINLATFGGSNNSRAVSKSVYRS